MAMARLNMRTHCQNSSEGLYAKVQTLHKKVLITIQAEGRMLTVAQRRWACIAARRACHSNAHM